MRSDRDWGDERQGRPDRRRRRRERVRERHLPDRRALRGRQRDREQPEHRPAHVRGQPQRRPGSLVGAADRPERGRLRHVHEQDRVGLARAPRARSSTSRRCSALPDSTPNPHLWYMPRTMPAVAQRARRGPVGDPAVARRLLRGQREDVRRLARSPGMPRCRRSQRNTRTPRSRPPSRSATTCSMRPGR